MRVARGAGTSRRVFFPVHRRMRDEPGGGWPVHGASGDRPAVPVLTETAGPRIFLPVTTMDPPSGPRRGRTASLVLAGGRLWGCVVVAVALLLAPTVALQNLGWAPAVPS